MSYFDEALKKAEKKYESDINVAKTKAKNAEISKRYGVDNPTVEDVSRQAAEIAKWDTEMDVTTFLNQAVTDGVVSPSDASAIFKKTTGGNLFGKENQQAVVSEASRRINGGTPVWVDSVTEKLYGDYDAEQAKAKLEELSVKESLSFQEENDFNYLLGKTDAKTAKYYLDNVKNKSEKEFEKTKTPKPYMGLGIGPMPGKVNTLTPEEQRVALEKYKRYKNLGKEAQNVYEGVKRQENVQPYIDEAKADKDFDKNSKYSGRPATTIGLYINGGSVYDNESRPDEGTAVVENDNLAYHYVTPEERDVYNYYVNTNQPEKAYEFAKKLEPELNKRAAVALQKDFAEMAEKYPITANALSVAMNVGTAPTAGMEFVSQMFTGEDFDPYAPGFRGNIASETIRGTTSENIKNDVARFFYNTGMSMADSLSVMPLGGAGIALLGTNAAISEGRKTALEGGEKWQIITKGLAAGAFEAAFEKIGLDNLFKPKAVSGLKKILKTTLQQAGIEASEELFTSIANNFIDDIVMGGESQYNIKVKEYMEKGMSSGEAEWQALMDMGGEVALETLAGAVSGGVFGLGGATINYANAVSTGKVINDRGNAQNVIDKALMQDTDSAAFKEGKALNGKEKVKNAEIGALLQQMIIDKQITEEDADRIVNEGINGIPLNEAEQAYYFAGANGVSATDAVKQLSDIDVDPERAIMAWKRGNEARLKENSSKPKAGTVTTKYGESLDNLIQKSMDAKVAPISRKVLPYEGDSSATPQNDREGLT